MIVSFALLIASAAPAPAPSTTMVEVGPGSYNAIDQKDVPARDVRRFLLDPVPVTNADFLAFVMEHDAWRRDRVKRLFAEGSYLASWQAPLDLGDAVDPRAPVVEVSWFAAAAYCEAQGKRLPTEAEWELAASASRDKRDARTDRAFVDNVLAWYAQRPTTPTAVGRGEPNAWGAYDMHTLVWEWVDDFTSSLAPTDTRGGSDAAFCGSAAGMTADAAAYAAFMRRAFRSSLEGSFTLPTLGFRCAKDLPRRRN